MVKWFCPLIKGRCKMHDCKWFLANEQCAVAVIAMRLDVLMEGVPVVRVFEEDRK